MISNYWNILDGGGMEVPKVHRLWRKKNAHCELPSWNCCVLVLAPLQPSNCLFAYGENR